MRKRFLAACAAALLIGSCSKATSPIVDGYTLHGVVTAQDGAPLRDVSVLVGREGSTEFHSFAMTGDKGGFLFQPSPATGPSAELFRFEKPGFVTREVLARTATRLEPYRYHLVVALDPE